MLCAQGQVAEQVAAQVDLEGLSTHQARMGQQCQRASRAWGTSWAWSMIPVGFLVTCSSFTPEVLVWSLGLRTARLPQVVVVAARRV